MQEKNRAAVFDLDGTLLDSGITFHRIVNELKNKLGQSEVDYELVRKYSSRGASLILKNCFPNIDEKLLKKLRNDFLKRYEEIIVDNLVLYEGVEVMLENLQAKGIKWGIVTNKSQKYTHPIVEKLGWLSVPLICPEDVAVAKPDPEGLLKVLKKLECDPKVSFYIGDHERDIETGINAGTKTVSCSWGYYESDPKSWNANFFIDSPLELIRCL